MVNDVIAKGEINPKAIKYIDIPSPQKVSLAKTGIVFLRILKVNGRVIALAADH